MFGLLNKTSSARIARGVAELGSAGSSSTLASFAAYRTKGFTAGTRLATSMGWRKADAITVGDKVMTFDNGMQEVVAVTRGVYFASDDKMPDFACPIRVPAEAIGNEFEMILLPDQTVMIESDQAEDLYGDPFALVRAKTLVGYRGIERVRGMRPVEICTLHFAEDEVVFADGGALMFAPSAVPGVTSVDFFEGNPPARYDTLSSQDARALVDAMANEDARAYAAKPGIANAA